MSFDSFNAVYYTGLFIVPGYIIEEIIGALMPIKTYSDGVKLLRCLIYSVVNCAGCSWAYILITKYFTEDDPVYWLLGVLVTLLGAVLLGFVVGLIRKHGIIRDILSRYKIQIENDAPSAWDYKFSSITDKKYVIVDMTDDTKIYGLFAYNSFASSVASERDLYLEQCYTYEEGQPWKPLERNEGILIKWSMIKAITFFEDQYEGDNKDE